jgi:hypothetical protein
MLRLLRRSSRQSAVQLRSFSANSDFYDLAGLSMRKVPEFSIIDTTLREGEQFATTEFTSHDRIYLAKLLDTIGVDYIELVNPFASKQVGDPILSTLVLKPIGQRVNACRLGRIAPTLQSWG